MVEAAMVEGAFARAYSAAWDMPRSGLSYRQIDYWTRTGMLHPLRPATGSGGKRLYSEDEYLVACAAKMLLDAGFVPQKAVELARRLQTGERPFDIAGGLLSGQKRLYLTENADGR